MKWGHEDKHKWDAYVLWLLEETSTDHPSTVLEAKLAKPAEGDKMQWQGCISLGSVWW